MTANSSLTTDTYISAVRGGYAGSGTTMPTSPSVRQLTG